MSRPRVRTKTGCLTCRTRRKKCDESKPICGACRSLRVACTWSDLDPTQPRSVREGKSRSFSSEPAVNEEVNENLGMLVRQRGTNAAISTGLTANEEANENLGMSAHRPGIDPAVSSGYPQPRSEYDMKLFQAGYEALKAFGSPLASNASRDFALIYSIAISDRSARAALTAFGGMTTAQKGELNPYSLRLYTSAIQMVREKLQDQACIKDNIASILICAKLFGTIESHAFRCPDYTMNHFMGILTLLSDFGAIKESQTSPSELVVFRCVGETSIYNIAVHSIFYADLARLPGSINRRILERYFDHASATPLQAPFLFAGQLHLWYLMYEVTVLGRSKNQDGLSRSDQGRVARIEIELFEISQKLAELYVQIPDAALRAHYIILAELNVASLRIILEKIKDSRICGTSSSIATTLCADMALLKRIGSTSDRPVHVSFGACWPLIVHICAASDQSDIKDLEEIAEKIKADIRPSHAGLLDQAMEKARSVRIHSSLLCGLKQGDHGLGENHAELQMQARCNAQHDAMSLLVSPEGLS